MGFKSEHISVLLKEAVDALNVKAGGRYIDCNLGGGGHAIEIINRGGVVAGLEIDMQAIEHCSQKFAAEVNDHKLLVLNCNFKDIDKVPEMAGWKDQKIHGILYDLGLSTFQLRDENKGFSFEDKSPLDMRVDESLGVKAEDLIKVLPVKDLADLFYKYGDEPQSKAFAKAMKDFSQKKKGIFTAKEMAEVIRGASRYAHSRIHPATRVFQALRIAVNNEVENLEVSVKKSIPLLKTGGRLVIISFHSLEDRIAKDLSASPHLKAINESMLTPSEEEIERNNSSRSSKMRVYERI